MKVEFSTHAWEDFQYWLDTDPDIADKIRTLIKECQRTPHKGTGKPEPLKGQLKGWWSRRITHEHRLVYRVRGKAEEQKLEVAQCRYHY